MECSVWPSVNADTPPAPSPAAPRHAEFPLHPPRQTQARSHRASNGHKRNGSTEPSRHRTLPRPALHAQIKPRLAARQLFANLLLSAESPANRQAAREQTRLTQTDVPHTVPASAARAAQNVLRE